MKAFPTIDYVNAENSYIYESKGMDLRDYFAAKVMHFWLTYPMTSSIHIENMCKGAYLIADEMVKARAAK